MLVVRHLQPKTFFNTGPFIFFIILSKVAEKLMQFMVFQKVELVYLFVKAILVLFVIYHDLIFIVPKKPRPVLNNLKNNNHLQDRDYNFSFVRH